MEIPEKLALLEKLQAVPYGSFCLITQTIRDVTSGSKWRADDQYVTIAKILGVNTQIPCILLALGPTCVGYENPLLFYVDLKELEPEGALLPFDDDVHKVTRILDHNETGVRYAKFEFVLQRSYQTLLSHPARSRWP